MPERTFIIRASTAGSPSRSYRDRGGGYRWHGISGWPENYDRSAQPAEPQPANVKAITSRKDRVARYCEHRAEGRTRAEAAALVGVGRSASRAYEDEFRARQAGAPS